MVNHTAMIMNVQIFLPDSKSILTHWIIPGSEGSEEVIEPFTHSTVRQAPTLSEALC